MRIRIASLSTLLGLLVVTAAVGAEPPGQLKIGTRREWGSTVVFFGLADGNPGINNSNTIDANDTGRELQVALYDYPRLRQRAAERRPGLRCRSDYESRQRYFQAWQLVGNFNNFRALFEFGLPALSTVRARAYLILGGFDAIAEAAASIDDRLSPFGELESPAPDATVGDSLWLSGWTLDNGQVVKLEVLIDGEPVAIRAPNRSRPDVCTLWPGYDMCAGKAGYSLRVDLSRVSRCAHLLEIRATDDDGNRRTIARRRIFVADPVCTGPGCEEGRSATHPVFRFFWAGNDDADHQFSRSDEAPPDLEAEGIGFELFGEPAADKRPLWQKWCSSCTDHLQTTIGAEGEPDYSGGRLLGYCSAVRTRDAPRRLLRLWSERLSDHFVSADPSEWEAAEARGYVSEGSCWVP